MKKTRTSERLLQEIIKVTPKRSPLNYSTKENILESTDTLKGEYTINFRNTNAEFEYCKQTNGKSGMAQPYSNTVKSSYETSPDPALINLDRHGEFVQSLLCEKQNTLRKNEDKTKQQLRISAIKNEEKCKHLKTQLNLIQKQTVVAKKSKKEITEANEIILKEIEEELSFIQSEKQLHEKRLERLHSDNLGFLDEALKPLESTGEEIIRQKKVLSERIVLLHEFHKQNNEELQILREDMQSHEIQRVDIIAQREELEFLEEQMRNTLSSDFMVYMEFLNGKAKEEDYYQCIENNFFKEVLIQILEKLPNIDLKKSEDFQFSLLRKPMQTLGEAAQLAGLQIDPSGIARKKEIYKIQRKKINEKMCTEYQSVTKALKAADFALKNNIFFVENKITPQITAAKETETNLENRSKKMKEQYDLLLQAEKELHMQIHEIQIKKKEQMELLSKTICADQQLEDLERKERTLLARKVEKNEVLHRAQQELEQIEAEAKLQMEDLLQEIKKHEELGSNLRSTIDREEAQPALTVTQEKVCESGRSLLAETMKRVIQKTRINTELDGEIQNGTPKVECLPLQQTKDLSPFRPKVSGSMRSSCNSMYASGSRVSGRTSRRTARINAQDLERGSPVALYTYYGNLPTKLSQPQCDTRNGSYFTRFISQKSNPSVENTRYCRSRSILDSHKSTSTFSDTRLTPLLKGMNFYKKFHTLSRIEGVEFTPENCGYGLRHISISADLKNLVIRQNKTDKAYYNISLSRIRQPVIPPSTLEKIRSQVPEPRKKTYFPFFLDCTPDEPIEFIATDSESLKQFVVGLNLLL